MSRHLLLLESHLPAKLLETLNHLVDEANSAGRSMFVTGSTMRDVLAGLQPQELELVVDGDAAKLRAAAGQSVPVRICEAAVEQASKPGSRPKLVPSSIHDFLRTRDFSVNAVSLSVTRASRGLLLDPTNGAADVESRELRSLSSHLFQTHPVKMLELVRLKVRLGFAVFRRTQVQFDEALEAGAYRKIRPSSLRLTLEQVAAEPKAVEILQAWDEAGMLGVLLPAVAGESLNTNGFTKVQKIRQLVPYGIEFPVDEQALFFSVLTENLSPGERAVFIESAGLDVEADWTRLGRRISKAEKELTAPSVQKPSQIFEVLTKAGPGITLLLGARSTQRVVQDRIRNYLTKYLATASEAQPGQSVARLLDARPKRVAAPGATEIPEDSVS